MSRKALVIEDNPEVRQVVLDELGCLDFDCEAAADGARGG